MLPRKLLEIYVKEIVESTKDETQYVSPEDVKFDYDPTEAPKDAPLGNYAFAPDRSMYGGSSKIGDNIPNEPNTSYENELYNAIKQHLSIDNQPLNFNHVKKIKNMMNNRFYKKIFRHPETDEIFRGQVVKISRLKNWLGLKEDEKIPQYKGEANVDFIWRPTIGPQFAGSWTVDYYTAKHISDKNPYEKKPCGVILHASPGQREKFLAAYPAEGQDNFTGLYRIFGESFSFESEAISLEPIRVSKIEWEIPSELRHLVKNDVITPKTSILKKFLKSFKREELNL